MTVREIRGHLEELYGIDVSPDPISAVTDAVLEEVAEWQNRPLDAVYPLVFFDAIRVVVDPSSSGVDTWATAPLRDKSRVPTGKPLLCSKLDKNVGCPTKR